MNDDKASLGKKILILKRQKDLKWSDIAAHIGQAPVWTCAACLGQMSMPPDLAQKTADLLGLSDDDATVLSAIPYRGALPATPSTDPLIYRFHELVSVYGTTWKELIQEEFGDGIMSAIDFDMTLERQSDEKGDRVRLVLSGKFLSYKRY